MPATRPSNKEKDFSQFFNLVPYTEEVEKPATSQGNPSTPRSRRDSLPRVTTPEPGLEYQSSQLLSAGPEEIEAATTLLQMRYGTYPVVHSTPRDAAASSSSAAVIASTTSCPLSTFSPPSPPDSPSFSSSAPVVASTTSNASSPLSTIGSPSPPDSPTFSPPMTDPTPITTFTPINAPDRSHSASPSSSIPFLHDASLPAPSLPALTSPSVQAPAPTPNKLIAYLNTRNPTNALRRAETIAYHPTRTVHLPPSPAACTQCQAWGFECVTVPEMKHCAFCSSRNGKRLYVCSTGNERSAGRGYWRGGKACGKGAGRVEDEMELDEGGE
ncbi:hypothetical protein MMC30_004713 [Trapelia coarctata]|nr:hypothetical protein [Trapelia coarctata]